MVWLSGCLIYIPHCVTINILRRPHVPRQPLWTEEKFHDSFDAETALCDNRGRFIQQPDIMGLVPDGAKKLILDSSRTSHPEGFRDLFAFLDKSPGLNSALSHLILKYFGESPVLHQHLSESLGFVHVAPQCFR